MVLDNRVAWYVQHVAILIVLKAFGAQRNTLVQRYMVANDTGLANDDTCAVVDGKVLADAGARMDVNTRL